MTLVLIFALVGGTIAAAVATYSFYADGREG